MQTLRSIRALISFLEDLESMVALLLISLQLLHLLPDKVHVEILHPVRDIRNTIVTEETLLATLIRARNDNIQGIAVARVLLNDRRFPTTALLLHSRHIILRYNEF